MDESTRIDENMTRDGTSPSILLKSEDEYPALSKLISISECISGNHSDRESIDEKYIESEPHRVASDHSSLEREYLTRDERLRSNRESIGCRCDHSRNRGAEIRRREWYMSKSNSRGTRAKPKMWGEVDISSDTLDIANSTSTRTISKELKKSARLEEYSIGDTIAKRCNNISCRIYRRKSKSR